MILTKMFFNAMKGHGTLSQGGKLENTKALKQYLEALSRGFCLTAWEP